jgi:hypothetical protein
MIQPDIGRHKEERKELARNRKENFVGIKEELETFCPLTSTNGNDVRGTKGRTAAALCVHSLRLLNDGFMDSNPGRSMNICSCFRSSLMELYIFCNEMMSNFKAYYLLPE